MFEVTYTRKCFATKYKRFKEFEKFFLSCTTDNISKHAQCIYGHIIYDTVIVS